MKNRRWFAGPKLTQWKMMTASKKYCGPFATFPQPDLLIEQSAEPVRFRFIFNIVTDWKIPEPRVELAAVRWIP
jgi:hypothetical protein